MDKLLVLGINGFTGRHLQLALKKQAWKDRFQLIGIDLADLPNAGFPYHRCDVEDIGALERLLERERPEYLINLIGSYKEQEFSRLFRINAEYSRLLCDCLARLKYPIRKILFVGSAAEYGPSDHLPITENDAMRPVNWYGLVKLFQTQIAQFYYFNHHLNISVARAFNIIGEGLSPALSLGSFLEQIKNAVPNGNINVGNVSTRRDFLDIDDVIEAYLCILISGKPGEIYNVCSGHSTPIFDIVSRLVEMSGKQIQICVTQQRVKKYDISDSFGSHEKLTQDTGWQPRIELAESLARFYSSSPDWVSPSPAVV